MWPAIGLCWGTVRQASLLELIDVAALHGFPTITVPPAVFELCLASGATVASLRQRLADAGIRVTVIDALTRDLPGSPSIDEVPAIWRENWRYGLDDLMRMAEALEAPTINVTHYLGKPVTPPVMAQAIAGLGKRAGRHGLQLSLEFIPETSLASLGAAANIVQLSAASNVGIMSGYLASAQIRRLCRGHPRAPGRFACRGAIERSARGRRPVAARGGFGSLASGRGRRTCARDRAGHSGQHAGRQHRDRSLQLGAGGIVAHGCRRAGGARDGGVAAHVSPGVRFRHPT